MTKVALASQLEVTSRTVTEYERGAATPGDQTLVRLAEVLGFPVDFFFQDSLSVPDLDGVSFRALSKMSGQRSGSGTECGSYRTFAF